MYANHGCINMRALETAEFLEAYESYVTPRFESSARLSATPSPPVVAGGFRSFLTITVEQRAGAPDVTGTRVQQRRTPEASIDKWYSAGGTAGERFGTGGCMARVSLYGG